MDPSGLCFQVADIYLPVYAGEYTAAECAGRNSYDVVMYTTSPDSAVWGGTPTRVVTNCFEWAYVNGETVPDDPTRADILDSAAAPA